MLLGIVGDTTFELLLINAILEHGDLVLEVVLDGLDHGLLALELSLLGLARSLPLLKHLALFVVRSELHDLLLEAHLLSASLDNLAALLAEHLFLEALLSQLLDLVVASLNALLPLDVLATLVLLNLDVVLVLPQQVLELLLLLEDLVVLLNRAESAIVGTLRPTGPPLRRHIVVSLLSLGH